MLADVRLHLKDVIGGGFFAPVVVRAAVSSAIALPSGRFGHDALRVTIASNIHLEESNGSSHKSQLLLHRVRRSWQTRIAKCQKFVLRLIDKPGHAILVNLALLSLIDLLGPNFMTASTPRDLTDQDTFLPRSIARLSP